MDIRPIRTEEDYRATLREIESLMRADPGSPEGERLDRLVTLVEVYERQEFPLDLSDPEKPLTASRASHTPRSRSRPS